MQVSPEDLAPIVAKLMTVVEQQMGLIEKLTERVNELEGLLYAQLEASDEIEETVNTMTGGRFKRPNVRAEVVEKVLGIRGGGDLRRPGPDDRAEGSPDVIPFGPIVA